MAPEALAIPPGFKAGRRRTRWVGRNKGWILFGFPRTLPPPYPPDDVSLCFLGQNWVRWLVQAAGRGGHGNTIVIGLDGHDPLSGLTCCPCIQNQGSAGMEEGMKGYWVDSQQCGLQYVIRRYFDRDERSWAVELDQCSFTVWLFYFILASWFKPDPWFHFWQKGNERRTWPTSEGIVGMKRDDIFKGLALWVAQSLQVLNKW